MKWNHKLCGNFIVLLPCGVYNNGKWFKAECEGWTPFAQLARLYISPSAIFLRNISYIGIYHFLFWKEEQWIKKMILNVQIAEKERVSVFSIWLGSEIEEGFC